MDGRVNMGVNFDRGPFVGHYLGGECSPSMEVVLH